MPSSLQWNQLGNDIDGEFSEFLGYSVHLSPNGNRLWAGGTGKLRIFDKRNTWKPVGVIYRSFLAPVRSVAASSDGRIFVVGGNNANSNDGVALVFQEGRNGWYQMGTTLNGESNSEFGHSVDVNGNGDVVVVGAKEGNYFSVYGFLKNSWVRQRKINGGDNIFFGSDGLGYSVGLSSDASRLAVGAPKKNFSTGAVFVYNLESYSTVLRLYGDSMSDDFGWSVAMSSDGHVLAAGAKDKPYVKVCRSTDDARSGYALVGANIVGPEDSDYGQSISLSTDGGRMVIGASSDDEGGTNSGKAFVYAINNNSIKLIGEFLGEAAGDFSGISVAISDDGRRVAVGAVTNNGGGIWNGHVRVFESSGV